MADNEGKEEPAARGNEWEVVSLTSSAYAAAPGPKQVDVIDDETGNSVRVDEAETSHAMVMSGHFVFPPSQHENLPLELESNEIRTVHENEDGGNPLLADEGIRSEMKGQEKTSIIGLTMSDEFPGIQIFDERGNIFSVGGAEFEGGNTLKGLNLVDKEQSIYSSAKLNSFCSETALGGPTVVEQSSVVTEVTEAYDEDLDSGISNLPNPTDKDYDGCDLPCGAWWTRRAASLYAHAKEANAFWSIFIAAAVMGLVILGQRWQQERWQILQLKWQFSINDERMGRMLAPLTRLKDVIVGGQRRGSLIRGSTSGEH